MVDGGRQLAQNFIERAERAEAENAELRTVLAEGVKLLRTVYGSKGDFAYEAQMWVLGAEAALTDAEAAANDRPLIPGDKGGDR